MRVAKVLLEFVVVPRGRPEKPRKADRQEKTRAKVADKAGGERMHFRLTRGEGRNRWGGGRVRDGRMRMFPDGEREIWPPQRRRPPLSKLEGGPKTI